MPRRPGAINAESYERARKLRAAGLSLTAIAKATGAAYSTVHRWTKDVRPDLARPAEHTAAIREARSGATAELAAEVKCGDCGTPGCEDPDCAVPYGQCHCRCGRAAPLANASDRKRGYVKGEPHLYVLGHNPRGLTVAVRDSEDLRSRRIAAGYTARGLSLAAKSLAAKVSGNTMSELEGVVGFRIHVDAAERIAELLGSSLVELFTREVAPAAERRPDIVRVRAIAPLPRAERYDGRHFRALADERRSRGEWSDREVAEYLGLHHSAPARFRRRGLLEGNTERDVKVCAHRRRQWDQLSDAKARLALDPDARARFAAAIGLPAARVLELRDRVETANELHARIRVGTGRPRSDSLPPDRVRRAEAFGRLMAAELASYERDAGLELPDSEKPTKWSVAGTIATEDHVAYPECWPYDPKDAPRQARQRVLEDVKALQTAQTRTRLR